MAAKEVLGKFQPISYRDLLRRHTTRKGISPCDNSVYVVAGTYTHDLFGNTGDTLKYCMSTADRVGNAWLDGKVGSAVQVYLNLKYHAVPYFYCGQYEVGERINGQWTLSRTQVPPRLSAWLGTGFAV